MTTNAERLTGVRASYDAAPPELHDWVESLLGARVVDALPRSGGMSPAMAVSLRAANGATAFVKALGNHLNPDTPTHFRHEIAVLSVLPAAPYRASLLSSYDDGHWVAIALEDVHGRHPDWSSAHERTRVFECVLRQATELTPPPAGVPTQSNRDGLGRFLDAMRHATADELAALPAWAASELAVLVSLCEGTLAHHRDESFCHWDIRHDNILVRHADNQPVLLDWGMGRLGPRWGDPVIFAVEWAALPYFDELVDGLGLSREEGDDVTGFLAGLGTYLLIASTHPAPPGLPNLPAFRRHWGAEFLAGVRRRLSR